MMFMIRIVTQRVNGWQLSYSGCLNEDSGTRRVKEKELVISNERPSLVLSVAPMALDIGNGHRTIGAIVALVGHKEQYKQRRRAFKKIICVRYPDDYSRGSGWRRSELLSSMLLKSAITTKSLGRRTRWQIVQVRCARDQPEPAEPAVAVSSLEEGISG